MSMRGEKSGRDDWVTPTKADLIDRIERAEFRRELCHHREPDFGSWEWELARHRGLWNYWREEDEFCDAMHQRFPIPD